MTRGLVPGLPAKPPTHVRATVISDVLDNSRIEEGPNGFVAHRTMVVADIPGAGQQVLYNALLARGVPYYGQSHPVIVGLPCTTRVATLEKDSQHKVRIDLTYEYPSGGGGVDYGNDPDDESAAACTIEIANTVQGSTTERDHAGNWLEVPEYTYTVIETDDDTGISTERQVTAPARIAAVEYQLPMLIVRYMRRERNSPGVKSRQYTGKINATPVFTDDPHYWMCTGITGQSDDGGLTYNVQYEFQYNPDTWDTLLAPRTDDGQPIPGAPTVTEQIYKEIDFWPLNLTVA